MRPFREEPVLADILIAGSVVHKSKEILAFITVASPISLICFVDIQDIPCEPSGFHEIPRLLIKSEK